MAKKMTNQGKVKELLCIMKAGYLTAQYLTLPSKEILRIMLILELVELLKVGTLAL